MAGILSLPLRAHALGEQHEGRVFVALEDLASPLGEHDRRERPEGLPVLDPRVEHILHLGLARVGEDAAIAERARAELGAALKPADDLPSASTLAVSAVDVVASAR